MENLARHWGLTAHARARYRCFLPDLAGLAGVRRARPMPDFPILASGHWRAGLAICLRAVSDFRCKNRVEAASLLVGFREQ